MVTKTANGTEDLALKDAPVEKPVFDFSEVSWGESSAYANMNVEMAELANKLGEDPEARERIMASSTTAIEFLAKCVVSVPRSWLIKAAPKDIDWSDTASYKKYLNAQGGRKMNQACMSAMQEDPND